MLMYMGLSYLFNRSNGSSSRSVGSASRMLAP